MNTSDGVDLATRRAIEDLLTEFAWRADHGRADIVHELFTEDGSIRGPGLDMRGRAEIAARFAERAADPQRVSRHAWSNPRFERLDDDAVRVVTIVQTSIHRLEPGQSLPAEACTFVVGDSDDVVVRGPDGQWRFRSRELGVAFRIERGTP